MSAGEFAVSAAAAGMAHVLHHPLYTLKSQMMFHGPKFSIRSFLGDVRHRPVGFLYKGLVSRTFGIMPEKAFKMQGWIFVGRYMESRFEKPTISKWIVAGAAAGAATTIIGCPSERAMVLAQVQQQQGQGFREVVRKQGLSGLYHGWRATLYRDVYFNMTFFTFREIFVSHWRRRSEGQEPSPGMRVVLGIPAGCIASVVACPFDVVKTRMQGKELLGHDGRHCARIMWDIVRHEGPRNLMKGLLPRLIAVPSMMSWFYMINEELEWAFLRTRHV